MAEQRIYTGVTGNDGTGDKLKYAFDKSNHNFDELYANDRDHANAISLISVLANDAFDVANAAYNAVNSVGTFESSSYAVANAAFDVANISFVTTNASFDMLNSAYTVANVSFDTTNSAFDLANTSLQTTPYYSVGSGSRTISFNTGGGLNPPNLVDRSGERLILWDQSPSYYNYGIGMETNNMWFGVDEGAPTHGFNWYKGNTNIMKLDRTANLFVSHINVDTAKFNDGSVQTVAYNSIVFNTLNAAYTVVNASYGMANANFTVTNAAYTSSNANYVVTNAAYTMANMNYTVTNAAYTSVNAAYTVANAAYNFTNTKTTYTNSNVAAYLNDGTPKVVTGNFTVTGMMVLNGNTNFVQSNNTVYTDNLIEIHAPGGNVDNAWAYTDGKDIGVRMHYYNSGNKHAALVLANDTRYLEWYIEGNEVNGVFTGGTYGDIKANNFYGNLKGTANNTLYVGSTDAANVISNSSLQYFLGFYASLANLASVNAYTNLVGSSANSWANSVGVNANTYSTGYANTVVINANTYAGVMANASNAWANTIGFSSNAWANAVGVAGNSYTQSVGASGNAYVNLSTTSANNYAGVMANSSNAYAVSVGAAGNAYTNLVGSSANNYAGSMSNTALVIAQAAFNAANNAGGTVNLTPIFTVANAAFDKANAANVLAYNTGIGANAYASSVGVSANAYAVTVGASSNAYANVVGAASNTYASSVGVAANNYANTLLTTTSNAVIGNVTINYVLDSGRFTKLSGVEESFGTYTSVSGTTPMDCSNNYIFYVTPASNFTPNLSNFICDTNNVTSITMIINQGGTPYMISNYLYVGSANLSINWQGGTPPTGTASKKDIVTLSVINVNGANTILGQLVSFG